MKINKLNKDKGVAGLNVLLSVIALLFMIGLIVMVFVIAGSRLETSVIETDTTSTSENNITVTDSGYTLTACDSARDGTGATVSTAINATGGETIGSGNYTSSGCILTAVGATYNNTQWNVTYSYSYTSNTDAVDSINATKTSIGSVTDWFDIFIVLTALVVLVLLVVIIINSIRGSGLMGGNGGEGNMKEFA